jgi:hypothetical protein
MHGVVVVEDCGREFAQRFGGIGVNGLPNDHPLMAVMSARAIFTSPRNLSAIAGSGRDSFRHL